MPNKPKNHLPDPQAPVVLVKAETWKKISSFIQLLDSSFDPRYFVTKQKADGKQITLRPLEEFVETIKSAATPECPLGDLKRDTANSTEQLTKYKITPGYVHGGGSSLLLDKDNITPVANERLYLEITYTANTSNGVLLSSGTMDAAEIKQGATIPADDEITINSLTGKHRRELGVWLDDGNGGLAWIKDACGSYTFKFCRVFSGFRGAQSNI